MKENIALLLGGYTGESVISYKSAQTVQENLDATLFRVYPIEVTLDAWFYVDENGKKLDINKSDFSIDIDGSKIKFHKAFICIHGTPGEDGKIQGYLDMLKIPYNTCGAMVSAITMNKSITKSVLGINPKIHMAKSILMRAEEEVDLNVFSDFIFPLFVKTNSGGSSIGMSKAEGLVDMKTALDKAFKEDQEVIIEEFIEGRELTIGVFQYKGKVIPLPPTEIFSKKDFFDFEAKYTPGIALEVTPAQITKEELTQLNELAIEVYQSLQCRGIVRIDVIFDSHLKKFYFLEVNTVPGQTKESIVPKQVLAAGMNLKDFYTSLVQESRYN